MSAFGDEIYRALTGRTGGPGASFDDMVRELIEYRGITGESRSAMAKRIGIPETTMRRFEGWITRPPTTSQGRVGKRDAQSKRLPQMISAYRQAIADPEAVERWRQDDIRLHVYGISASGRSGRTTDLDLTPTRLKWRYGAGSRVVDAYMRGDDQAAARAFVAGIGDHWYRTVMFQGWIAPQFDDLTYREEDEWDSDYQVAGASVS